MIHIQCIIAWLLVSLCVAEPIRFEQFSFNKYELEHYKNEVQELFNFAYDNYMNIGYPYDEVRPISCVPKTRNFDDPSDLMTNDVLGNFTATLVDSLTTLAVMGDKDKFQKAVELINSTFPSNFEIDSTVQVFETTIRIVGSLLSAHLYATDPSKKVYLSPENYGGDLLRLARDMADRLLPAYLTETGLPVARINLKHKFELITPELVAENNVAAMGSPMLELTLLSYLTHDEKYAKVSRYAYDKTWSLRSSIDLLPMSFNPQTGQIFSQMTGIGASIDSFFEYALKGSVLFNDEDLYKIWEKAYRALRINCKADWFFVNAHYMTGQLTTLWIDSLSAFFSGLQVLAGNLQDSISQHLMFLKLWDTFGGIPERWQFQGESNNAKTKYSIRYALPLEWYGLRPEFIESTYFLYRATKDPFYLNVGYRLLKDIKENFKHECGLGGWQDIVKGTPQDRMESFVLSESLKYLYLLFDDDNEIHSSRNNVIFSTEAHPMWLTPEKIRTYQRNAYFNDTVYITHLSECQKRDRRKLSNAVKKHLPIAERLISFAKKYLLNNGHEANQEQELSAIEQSEIKEYIKPQYCPRPPRFFNETGFLYSDILSGYSNLFEIEDRYKITLLKPKHMLHYKPIELTDGFYKIWAHPRGSYSKPLQTTESFEISMDIPGEYELNLYQNGSIHCPTLGGRRRLRLEKIQPGKIDEYGQAISSSIFDHIPRKDLTKSDCDEEDKLYSPVELYKVIVMDGIRLPKDGIITVGQEPNKLQEMEGETRKPFVFDLFGYNDNRQLMMDCIPIVNFYLV